MSVPVETTNPAKRPREEGDDVETTFLDSDSTAADDELAALEAKRQRRELHGRFPCEVQPTSSTFHDEPNLAGKGHDGSMASICFGQAGVQHVTDGGPAVGCGALRPTAVLLSSNRNLLPLYWELLDEEPNDAMPTAVHELQRNVDRYQKARTAAEEQVTQAQKAVSFFAPQVVLATLAVEGWKLPKGDGGTKRATELGDLAVTLCGVYGVKTVPNVERVSKATTNWSTDAELQGKLKEAESELQNAKSDLQNAKSDLQNAETKLQNAKSDLQNAKSDLQKAEADLAFAMQIPRILRNVERLMKPPKNGRAWLTIKPLDTIPYAAQGMDQLAQELCEKLPNFQSNFTKQSTVAFVWTCASGVGKTFFSGASPKLLSELVQGKVGALYLGFNTGMPLVEQERSSLMLNQDPQSALYRLLYHRVLIQLKAVLVKGPDAADGPFTFGPNGVQRMVHVEADFLRRFFSNTTPLDDLRQVTLELLAEVQKMFGLSHLMVVIDEGQKLDELIAPHPDGGGARCALRWTRELQLDAHTAGCDMVCFGLMTGINPDTSLAAATDGINYELTQLPMTPDQFHKLAELVFVSKTAEQVKILSKVFYPNARALRRCRRRIIEGIADLATVEIDSEMCLPLAVASMARCAINRGPWSCAVYSLAVYMKPQRRIPVLTLPALLNCLGREFEEYVSTKKIGDHARFEEFCGVAVCALIRVQDALSQNLPPLQDINWGKIMTSIFPDDGVRSVAVSSFPHTMRRCVGRYSFELPPDEKNVYHPSSRLVSHAHAFQEEGGALSTTFNDSVGLLNTPVDDRDNTMTFRCGGSAPIDFIILHKRAPKDWLLTLVDAKHTTTDPTTTTSKQTESMPDMANKGSMVYKFLRHTLKHSYGVNLQWENSVFLMTNATDSPPLTTIGDVTIVRLSPDTFTMGCLTDYLFALPSDCQDERKKSAKTMKTDARKNRKKRNAKTRKVTTNQGKSTRRKKNELRNKRQIPKKGTRK